MVRFGEQAAIRFFLTFAVPASRMVEQVPPGGFKAAADSHHDMEFAPRKLTKGKVPPSSERLRCHLEHELERQERGGMTGPA
jgi:hypothetical protein